MPLADVEFKMLADLVMIDLLAHRKTYGLSPFAPTCLYSGLDGS
jgi:hypothetical protein